MRTARITLPAVALVLAATVLSAPSAFAAPQARQHATEAEAVQADAETPAAEDTAITRRHCLRSTGSLITASRNRRAEREGKAPVCAQAFGRVYTNEDLRATGGTDVGGMLRSLDPAIR